MTRAASPRSIIARMAGRGSSTSAPSRSRETVPIRSTTTPRTSRAITRRSGRRPSRSIRSDPSVRRRCRAPWRTTGAASWYVSAVTVTITATSGSGSAVSIAYRLDGNAWATYATPIVLLDGRHVLEYLATDAQGYSEASKSAAINVDSTPPSLVANSPSAPLSPDASVSWSGSDRGSGIARYEVAIDGSPFASVGLQTTLTRTWSVGTHVVSVRAYDAAGNMKSSVIQFSVESNPTPANPSGAPSAPPGIAEIIVGIVMLAVSMRFRQRVVTRRPAPRA